MMWLASGTREILLRIETFCKLPLLMKGRGVKGHTAIAVTTKRILLQSEDNDATTRLIDTYLWQPHYSVSQLKYYSVYLICFFVILVISVFSLDYAASSSVNAQQW